MSSLSAIVPAYNEEGNIAGTLDEIVPLLEKSFSDYEILLFNDKSTDRTGEIADSYASRYKKIKVIHNPRNMGLGYNYRKGVEMASKDFVIMIPGDNEITTGSFEEMFRHLGEKDIIIPHTTNIEIRPLGRQILSRTYTAIINLLFGLDIQYYNGTVIHKRAIVQSMPINTDSFSYQTEFLVKLIKSGRTYYETGMELKPRGSGKSKALKPRNLWQVCKSIAGLFIDVQILRKYPKI